MPRSSHRPACVALVLAQQNKLVIADSCTARLDAKTPAAMEHCATPFIC